jgi:hypothetical protein
LLFAICLSKLEIYETKCAPPICFSGTNMPLSAGGWGD